MIKTGKWGALVAMFIELDKVNNRSLGQHSRTLLTAYWKIAESSPRVVQWLNVGCAFYCSISRSVGRCQSLKVAT